MFIFYFNRFNLNITPSSKIIITDLLTLTANENNPIQKMTNIQKGTRSNKQVSNCKTQD